MRSKTRRDFLKATGAASLTIAINNKLFSAKGKKKPINFLFIMTDQQKWDALSRAGNKVLKTPNLDRLADEGAFFENAYSPCPVCGPARTTILTGCSIETTNVRTNYESYKKKTPTRCPMKTFDEILIDKDYKSEYYGKWHSPIFRALKYTNPSSSPLTAAGKNTKLGPSMGTYFNSYLDKHVPKRELKEGEKYDVFSKRPYLMDPIDKRYGLKPDKKFSGRIIQPDCHGRLDVPLEHTQTAVQSKQTIDALKRLKDKPFSLTCSFHFPHSPMVVPEPYYSMYPPEKMVAPKSIHDPMKNSPYKKANGREKYTEYRDKEKIKYMISNYYGLIKEIDDWVGKILKTLKECGLEKNTMVIFTSDHGEMLGAHGMREKNVFYEESAHIPLMMRLPGVIKPKTVIKNPVSQINLFATILDYLKAGTYPSDGHSMRKLIDGTEKKGWDFAISEWNWRGDTEPNFMVRTKDWKYICAHSAKSKVIDVLYNLKKDPHEMNNLIGRNPDRKKYKKQAEKIKKHLLSWLKSVKSPHYKGVKERSII